MNRPVARFSGLRFLSPVIYRRALLGNYRTLSGKINRTVNDRRSLYDTGMLGMLM